MRDRSLSASSWRADKRTAAQRGYDSRWRRARDAFLSRAENVLCRMCQEDGRITKAAVVDHIKPHRGDAALFWDEGNWQPLCRRCHDSRKQAEERGRKRHRVGLDGWPVDG